MRRRNQEVPDKSQSQLQLFHSGLLIQNFDLLCLTNAKVETLQCSAVASSTGTPHQGTSLSLCVLLLINGRSLVILRHGSGPGGTREVPMGDGDRLGLNVDPGRGTLRAEEQARGPGDNGSPLTPPQRKHVYGYLEEIDLIVPEMRV